MIYRREWGNVETHLEGFWRELGAKGDHLAHFRAASVPGDVNG
jgi:hypothetical protein